MLHLGDITKIDGHKVPIVDCVTFGAPCQDLSVAGKRAGMKHKDLGDEEATRSGLFMDAVRIIKEMREEDELRNGRSGVDVRPRYAVYENVPGAFSSNKGEDFRIVLEEIARIKDKDAVIPQPDKWQTSGCIVGDGWSIAWRVLDAQFWGVPQRRRRIALVADFGGHSASEILFVTEGVCGDTQPSQPKGKATPHDATGCTGADDTECVTFEPGIASREGGHIYENVSGTLRANAGDNQMSAAYGQPVGADQYNAVILGDSVSTLGVNCGMSHGRQCVLEPVYSVENHPADSRVDIDDTGKVQTLTSRMGTGGGNVPMVMEPTVFSKSKRAQNPTDYETWQESDTANTLNTFDQGDVRTNECVIALDRASYNQGRNAQFDIGISESGTAQSLVAKGPGAVCYTVDQGGGKSACNVQEGQAPTLTCTHGGEPAVCYSLDPLSSNSMKSSNPHSGCHETDVARTIDTAYPDPSKNQGGVAVVEQVGAFYPQMKAESQCFRTDGISNCLVNGTNPGFQNGLAIASVDCRNGTEDETNGALQSMASNNINSNNVVRTRYTVRRLTPLECERLQGYPSEYKVDVSQMTKDEYIAYNILEGNIIVDAEAGKVYRTRGPGGVKLDKPQEMKGSDCNGYLVVKISNGTTKMTCRIHRIVWISQYGVIPDGYCIDHINSNKKDNRISNLQLLTPQENSSKAAEDGLYATGEDNHATKVSPDLYDKIAYLHHCDGKTMRQLAEVYGISKSRVQQIVKEVGWTDIGEYTDSNGKKKQSSDAARYKALGNSIAIPPWKWVMKRLCACYERDATLASLFDGIGGFPYIWEQINGKGSCLWASEIEEFPMAVTKVRIGE